MERGKADTRLLLKVFSPIMAAIAIALTTSNILDYRFNLPINRLSMVLGISIGITLLTILSKTSVRELAKVFVRKDSIQLALIGYGAMMLRGVFTTLDLSCLIEHIPQNFSTTILVIAIPLLFSIIAGSPTTGIALSIPIIEGVIEITPSIASLVYVSSFMGYLGSPLHLCYIYTAEYLGISIIKGYRYLVPAIIATIIVAYIVTAI